MFPGAHHLSHLFELQLAPPGEQKSKRLWLAVES